MHYLSIFRRLPLMDKVACCTDEEPVTSNVSHCPSLTAVVHPANTESELRWLFVKDGGALAVIFVPEAEGVEEKPFW